MALLVAAGGATNASARKVVLHAVQSIKQVSLKSANFQRYVDLLPGEQRVYSLCVQPSHTLEVVVCAYWSASAPCTVDATVWFHGVQPSDSKVRG